MKQAARWQTILLAVAPIAPIIGAVGSEIWLLGGLLLLTVIAWGLAQIRRPVANDVGLTLFLAGLAYAAWLDVAGGWLIGGAAAALAAWDLGHFQTQMARQPVVINEAVLWRTHRNALALTLATGLVVSGLALVIRLELSFWLAFGLALFIVAALSWLLRANS